MYRVKMQMGAVCEDAAKASGVSSESVGRMRRLMRCAATQMMQCVKTYECMAMQMMQCVKAYECMATRMMQCAKAYEHGGSDDAMRKQAKVVRRKKIG